MAGAVTGVGALDVARFRKTLHTHSLTNFQHICVLSFSQCASHVLTSTFCAARYSFQRICVRIPARCAIRRVAHRVFQSVACSSALHFFFHFAKRKKSSAAKEQAAQKEMEAVAEGDGDGSVLHEGVTLSALSKRQPPKDSEDTHRGNNHRSESSQ